MADPERKVWLGERDWRVEGKRGCAIVLSGFLEEAWKVTWCGLARLREALGAAVAPRGFGREAE
jgi:hypothetical protein